MFLTTSNSQRNVLGQIITLLGMILFAIIIFFVYASAGKALLYLRHGKAGSHLLHQSVKSVRVKRRTVLVTFIIVLDVGGGPGGSHVAKGCSVF